MLLGIMLCASAQEGLHINEVFEGKLIDKEEIRESLIKGESLAPYKLNVLHTIKFSASSKERARVDALFTKDMEGCISDDESDTEYESEVEYVGNGISSIEIVIHVRDKALFRSLYRFLELSSRLRI